MTLTGEYFALVLSMLPLPPFLFYGWARAPLPWVETGSPTLKAFLNCLLVFNIPLITLTIHFLCVCFCHWCNRHHITRRGSRRDNISEFIASYSYYLIIFFLFCGQTRESLPWVSAGSPALRLSWSSLDALSFFYNLLYPAPHIDDTFCFRVALELQSWGKW